MLKERQLTYLTSGSQREADHFAIARLYQNPQGKLTILVNYVQNNAVAALTRRLYIMEGVWESESPSASAYAHWVVDQRHFYWNGGAKRKYSGFAERSLSW